MDQIEAIVREVVARLANEKKPCPDRLIPAEGFTLSLVN